MAKTHAPNVGGPGLLAGEGNRFHVPQLRPSTVKLIKFLKKESNQKT